MSPAHDVAVQDRSEPEYGAGLRFWDERYRNVPEPWEWLEHYWDVSDFVEIGSGGNRTCRVLHAGCGSSLLTEHMYDAGYRDIVNIDISPAAIELMSARNLQRPLMRWLTMDATRMDFTDGCFDLVFDKTLLDTFACAASFDQLSADYMHEVWRILRDGGAFVCVSFNREDSRLRHLTWKLGFRVRKHTRCTRGSKLFFVYVCQKAAGTGSPLPRWQGDGDEESEDESENDLGEEPVQADSLHDSTAGARDLASFICLDHEGNGAEVWGSIDSHVGDVFDRAVGALKETVRLTARNPRFVAQHVDHGHRQKELASGDPVPAELFFVRDYGDGTEPAVTWITVAGIRFGARNKVLETRLQRVLSLVEDLNTAFGTQEYQEKLNSATDRNTVEALIREVQTQVMSKHGFPILGASPGKAFELVLQMKGFNGSANFCPEVGQAVNRSFMLSGYMNAASLPVHKKGAGKRAPKGAAVQLR